MVVTGQWKHLTEKKIVNVLYIHGRAKKKNEPESMTQWLEVDGSFAVCEVTLVLLSYFWPYGLFC